jgi:hypothetical protein
MFIRPASKQTKADTYKQIKQESNFMSSSSASAVAVFALWYIKNLLHRQNITDTMSFIFVKNYNAFINFLLA